MKSLWLLNSPNSFGQITLSTLEISLRAGRMDDKSIKRIITHFMGEAKECLDVLDFVAYMPFFSEMHSAVTEAPLSNDVRQVNASKMTFADQAFRDKRVDISRWRTLKRVFVSRKAFASVAHVAQTARRRKIKKSHRKSAMIEANQVRRSLVKAVSASRFHTKYHKSEHIGEHIEE